MRTTIACPEALMADANQLMMVLMEGPADALTFRSASWERGGAKFAVASFEATPEWLETAQVPLQRPAWDRERIIDMQAAERAQKLLHFWSPGEDAPEPPKARNDDIPGLARMQASRSVEQLGVTRIETEEV
jgi:hypothetical protein